MASLSTAKVLGGVGGIFAIIPGVSLVGWILILVAVKEISDVTQDRSIFDDALIAGITAVIGAITFVVLLASGAFGGIITLGAIDFGLFGVLGALALLGTFWLLLIVSSVFLKRAYDKIAQRLNVGAFATAGLLYLIGALTVIVVVGFLILLIAMVFQIVATVEPNNRSHHHTDCTSWPRGRYTDRHKCNHTFQTFPQNNEHSCTWRLSARLWNTTVGGRR